MSSNTSTPSIGLTAAGTIAFSILLVGCATLFSGTSDDIQFESEPSGAKVIIDGIERGETPTTISVSRDAFNDKRVTLRKEGYEEEVFRLQKEFATVAILNLGNFLFWGIDALTGAMFKYRPTQYSMELEKKSMGGAALESGSSKEDYSAYGIEELRNPSTGEVILPKHEENVIIHDSRKELVYIFD